MSESKRTMSCEKGVYCILRIAILEVFGVLSEHFSWSFFTSTDFLLLLSNSCHRPRNFAFTLVTALVRNILKPCSLALCCRQSCPRPDCTYMLIDMGLHFICHYFQWHGLSIHITKTHLFKYIENFPPKNENFQMKNSGSFHISAQNIDCGYLLEPTQQGSSNEYPQSVFEQNKKINVYPSKPQFYCIKVGFKGVKTIWACFRDDMPWRHLYFMDYHRFFFFFFFFFFFTACLWSFILWLWSFVTH